MTTCACNNCQFFDSQSALAVKQQEKDKDSGLCRYNPPYAQPSANPHSLWPSVTGRDWCGHFAATVERFMSAAE